MKKQIYALALAVMLMMTGCAKNTLSVDRVVGESSLYSTREIQSAMRVVMLHFGMGFDDCTMTELRYDEERTLRETERNAEKGEKSDVIVLVSTISVGENHNGGFSPGETYTGWSWELTRRGLGGWKLTNSGFG